MIRQSGGALVLNPSPVCLSCTILVSSTLLQANPKTPHDFSDVIFVRNPYKGSLINSKQSSMLFTVRFTKWPCFFIFFSVAYIFILVCKQLMLSLKSEDFSFIKSTPLLNFDFKLWIVNSRFKWYIKSWIAISMLVTKLSKYLLALMKYFLTFRASDLFLNLLGLDCIETDFFKLFEINHQSFTL